MWWGLLRPGWRQDWGHRLLVGFVLLFNLPVLGMLYWGFYGLGVTVVDDLGLDALTRLLHLPVTAFGVFFLFLVLNRVHPVPESCQPERDLSLSAADANHGAARQRENHRRDQSFSAAAGARDPAVAARPRVEEADRPCAALPEPPPKAAHDGL